jgi:DNA-binding GntR family transcriptional regulator
MNDIHNLLRNDIVSGDLKCGSRGIIEDTALRRGIDHIPILEALRVLHGAGLVVTGRGDARSATRLMGAHSEMGKNNLLQRAASNPNPEVALA